MTSAPYRGSAIKGKRISENRHGKRTGKKGELIYSCAGKQGNGDATRGEEKFYGRRGRSVVRSEKPGKTLSIHKKKGLTSGASDEGSALKPTRGLRVSVRGIGKVLTWIGPKKKKGNKKARNYLLNRTRGPGNGAWARGRQTRGVD